MRNSAVFSTMLVLFLLTGGFSLFLSSTSLREYEIISSLRVGENAATQLQTVINRGLNFGKPLPSFTGLDAQMQHTHNLLPDIATIAVYTTQGQVCASLAPQPLQPLANILNASPFLKSNWRKTGEYSLVLPLASRDQSQAGYLLVEMNGESLGKKSARYQRHMLMLLAVACLAFLVFLLVGMRRIQHPDVHSDTSPYRSRVRLRRSIMLCAGAAQLFFTLAAAVSFLYALHATTSASLRLTGNIVAGNMELLVQKGLPVTVIPGLEAYMDKLMANTPDAGGIRLMVQDRILVEAGNDFSGPPESVPIHTGGTAGYNAAPVAHVDVYPNTVVERTIFWFMLRDQATALLIAFTMLYTLSYFAMVLLTPNDDAPASPLVLKQEKTECRVRLVFFLFFCAYDVVITFIPLVAKSLPTPQLSLPPDVLAGLPVSVEAAMSTVGAALAGLYNRRLGWKCILQTGVLCGIAGAVMCATAVDVLLFVGGRALSGFALGTVLMAGQFYVIENSPARLESLAALYAALFAGGLCGSATGGILYDLFPFSPLFLLSGVLMVPAMACLAPARATARPPQNVSGSILHTLLGLSRSPSFLVPVFLISIPTGMTLTGFFYLTVPTVLQQQGVLQADIGRLFMLYGFCFIVAGPYLAALAHKSPSQTPFVGLVGLAGGGGILLTSFAPGYSGYTCAVLLIGLSQCLLSSSMLEYILSLPALQQLDKSLVGGAYRLCERLGQIIGPLVFGAVLAADKHDIALLGGGIIAATLCFFLWVGVCRLRNS